ERIPVLPALRAVTSSAAWQTFHEKSHGSIEPGKAADLTILEKNPLVVEHAVVLQSRKHKGHAVPVARDPLRRKPVAMRVAEPPIFRVERRRPRSPRLRRFVKAPSAGVAIPDGQQIPLHRGMIHRVDALAVTCETKDGPARRDIASPTRLAGGSSEELPGCPLAQLPAGRPRQHDRVVHLIRARTVL